jgi:1-Cys peroxiredoxin 6
VLFSHPADFTPVCTTELARVVQLQSEFEKRGVKVIALSCDPVETHRKWLNDIKVYAGCSTEGFPYPIIADEDRKLSTSLQMIDPDERDADGIPLTARAVFIIDPRKRMRLSILYPATTGRNFSEILRVIDSLQLTDKHKVATPVDWKVSIICY